MVCNGLERCCGVIVVVIVYGIGCVRDVVPSGDCLMFGADTRLCSTTIV